MNCPLCFHTVAVPIRMKGVLSVCGRYYFLPVRKGVWVRTLPLVALVGCSRCGAKPDELCTGPHGPHAETHAVRRRAYQILKRTAIKEGS